MIRIGAVNIDTSHPMGFGEEFEKDTRGKYVGVYNDSFRNEDEVDGFIQRFSLEKKCKTIDELVEISDIGIIHGCDWDKHIYYAMPFIKKEKPVFIDKPLVGSITDCKKILELCQNGAKILGSSSVPYCKEIQNFLAIPIENRGEIISVFASSGVDEFNYGIHVVEGILALTGIDVKSVKFLGRGQRNEYFCESFAISFENGITAMYHTMTGCWQPFIFTIITTKNTYSFKIDSSKLYNSLVNEICNYMENKPNIMTAPEAIVQAIKVMLAGKDSRENNGKEIEINEISENLVGFDGKLFAKNYANASGPMYTQKN